MAVYGLTSGRLLRVIPVFSVDPEKGYGYSEETKALLNTSHGFIPWDDLHHIALSETDGIQDGFADLRHELSLYCADSSVARPRAGS